MNYKFKINDIVQVIDPEHTHSSYYEAAVNLKATNWQDNKTPIREKDYMVTNRGKFPILTSKIHIYLITDLQTSKQFLVNTRGLAQSISFASQILKAQKRRI